MQKKPKTQTNNKTTKLPKKFIKNQSEKESKERDRIQREIKVQQVLLRRKDIISCFAFSFIQMCVCQSVVVFCEATRRPVRRAPARCSTTATAAGAAERPGPRAVWRQPSFSGWRWMYLDRLSEDPGRRTGEEEVSIMYKKKCNYANANWLISICFCPVWTISWWGGRFIFHLTHKL